MSQKHESKVLQILLTRNNATSQLQTPLLKSFYPDTVLVDTVDCHCIVYGKDAGKSGAPHLQGAIVFKFQRHQSVVIKLLPSCPVEV